MKFIDENEEEFFNERAGEYDDYDYQERAGILQFDAGFTRAEAEIVAMRMIKEKKICLATSLETSGAIRA